MARRRRHAYTARCVVVELTAPTRRARKGGHKVDGTGSCFGADELRERDHEMRAALCRDPGGRTGVARTSRSFAICRHRSARVGHRVGSSTVAAHVRAAGQAAHRLRSDRRNSSGNHHDQCVGRRRSQHRADRNACRGFSRTHGPSRLGASRQCPGPRSLRDRRPRHVTRRIHDALHRRSRPRHSNCGRRTRIRAWSPWRRKSRFRTRSVHRPTTHGGTGWIADHRSTARRRRVVRPAPPHLHRWILRRAPSGRATTRGGRSMRGRVLVVDDHVLVAIGSQLALAARGWEVETCSGPTAPDVVAHAERFQPHCILLDINIGGGVGSGIDLIAPLLSTGAQIVMLTGERRRLVLAECIEAGAAGWIRKNAEIEEVESTVACVVDGGTLMGRADRAVADRRPSAGKGGQGTRPRHIRPAHETRSARARRTDRRSQCGGDRRTPLRRTDHSPLTDPGNPAEARRTVAVGRRRARRCSP